MLRGRASVVITQLPLTGLSEARIDPSPALTPFLKWPGGKSDELALIAAAAPALSGRLIDPFVGGGAVLLATPVEVPAWANDACADLVRLYQSAASGDPSARAAHGVVTGAWEALGGQAALYAELALAYRVGDDERARTLVEGRSAWHGRLAASAGPGLAGTFIARLERDVPTKLRRMRRIEAAAGPLSSADLLANIEGAVRAAFYMAVRQRYNEARLAGRWDAHRSADFLLLRELAYAAMFRFNARGEFNVPYGGISYNRKSLADKVRLMSSQAMVERLRATELRCLDFEPFLEAAAPTAEDLVFVDPPYNSDFSAYDDRAFGWRDQQRLRDVLATLPARVLVVIKDTPMIRQLYGSGPWRVAEAAKTYMWTIKARNERRVTHLLISKD